MNEDIMEKLKFILLDNKGRQGRFEFGESRIYLFEKFDQASELYDRGDFLKAQSLLKTIIEGDPEFIEAYHMLGIMEHENNNLEKAKKLFSQGVKIAENIIPNTFNGNIIWGDVDNRSYLRNLHGLGLVYMDLSQIQNAILIFKKIIRYNPNDNQGIRYLLGDLYLMNGNLIKAQSYYKDNLDYPPYLYSYALALVLQNKYTEAIKHFRLGFINNIYIAEIIREKFPLLKYDMWHSSNFEWPETANDYFRRIRKIWENSNAKKLLNRLFDSIIIQEEIENIIALKVQLNNIHGTNKKDVEYRLKILSEIDQIINGINDDSSEQIKLSLSIHDN
jgi:tetratricopeptide (TPR) repeat protein